MILRPGAVRPVAADPAVGHDVGRDGGQVLQAAGECQALLGAAIGQDWTGSTPPAGADPVLDLKLQAGEAEAQHHLGRLGGQPLAMVAGVEHEPDLMLQGGWGGGG